MFKSRTPKDIEDFTDDQILQMIEQDKEFNLAAPIARLQIIKMFYTVLNMDLSKDLLFMLLSEPSAKLCLATAGGGKTTAANIQILIEKVVRKSQAKDSARENGTIHGYQFLCLMYNKHNVEPFRQKHESMIAQIKSSGIKGFDVDKNLKVTTMHSYCDMWKKQYASECGLVGYTLLEDTTQTKYMQSSLEIVFLKRKLGDTKNVRVSNLLTLYSFYKESLYTPEQLRQNDKFIDLQLGLETVMAIFEMYEKTKKRNRKYDFTDMLILFLELIRTRKDILQEIQQYFEYVIADEVQDFTPLMFEILRLLVSDNTPLMCIGDEDQSIYGFRGADIYNTLDFSEKFNGGEVYVLSRNRRCRKNILNAAVTLIKQNNLRFDKEILSVKEGGNVSFLPYNTLEGQLLNLLEHIDSLEYREQCNTVICTREKEGTLLLTQLLAENNIAFNVISGYNPYTHELYRHVMDVMEILYRPMDQYAQLNLYKALPIKKNELMEILRFNVKREKFPDELERKHFAYIDYGNYLNNRTFTDCLEKLAELAKFVHEEPMSKYFRGIFALIKKNFWAAKQHYNKNEELDELFETKVRETFSSHLLYKDLREQIYKNKELCKKNNNAGRGVTVSTFHGLKGLEYKNVFMINMDNDIFPNFAAIEQRNYDNKLKSSLKEAETRLCYVAITRAIDNLYVYYSKENPSYYVRLLREKDTAEYVEVKNSNNFIESNKNTVNCTQLGTLGEMTESILDDIDNAIIEQPLIPYLPLELKILNETPLILKGAGEETDNQFDNIPKQLEINEPEIDFGDFEEISISSLCENKTDDIKTGTANKTSFLDYVLDVFK